MTESARSDAQERVAVRVAVVDCASGDQLESIFGSRAALIPLPGPVSSAGSTLFRVAAVFTGADGPSRWAQAVPLLAAACEGSGVVTRAALHVGLSRGMRAPVARLRSSSGQRRTWMCCGRAPQ